MTSNEPQQEMKPDVPVPLKVRSVQEKPIEAEQGVNDLLEEAWGIIANAGTGDWLRETPEWREAAARWRDRYHAHLRANPHLN